MRATPYHDVNEIIDTLLLRIQSILGKKLLALYLDGSLVIGDFDPGISDIDMVAALADEINDVEFEMLKKLHSTLVKEHPEWLDRIEVCYVTADALKNVKTRTSMIVNISPGEPIHRLESSKEWLMNWYLTREMGKTLYGPSPRDIIEPISKDEFIQCVKDDAKSWRNWIAEMRNAYAQSYAIFSVCRALYAYKNGEQVSKKQAGLWAQQELPEWADLIQNAFTWRLGGKYEPDDDITHPRTAAFAHYVGELIVGKCRK